jgi:hypothetical protein
MERGSRRTPIVLLVRRSMGGINGEDDKCSFLRREDIRRNFPACTERMSSPAGFADRGGRPIPVRRVKPERPGPARGREGNANSSGRNRERVFWRAAPACGCRWLTYFGAESQSHDRRSRPVLERAQGELRSGERGLLLPTITANRSLASRPCAQRLAASRK